MRIEFTINGVLKSFDIAANMLLLNLLREKLYLTGAKYGCGIGECGACTVLVDGNPILSCMTLAADVDGRNVQTVEDLPKGLDLDAVQEA